MKKFIMKSIFCFFFLNVIFLPINVYCENNIVLYAAAGLRLPLIEIIDLFEKETLIKVDVNFASSGVLARQIEAGAYADVFISASRVWMEYVENKHLVKVQTTKEIISDEIVLISSKTDNQVNINFDKDFSFKDSFKGYIAIGDFNHVPAGQYAKQALEHLGWWKDLKQRIILAKDVSHVLFLVETKEVDYAIVYYSVAFNSNKVNIVNIFPQQMYDPVIFFASICNNKKQDKEKIILIDFLISEKAQNIFKKYGFCKDK